MKKKIEIFISYAKPESDQYSDRQQSTFLAIYRYFHKKGFNVIANARMAYKESLNEYIQRLGYGKYIIIILSDAYLKSKNSMAEVLEMLKYPDFHDRIFPVVLDDAKIDDPMDLLDYVKYWEEKIEKLDKKIRTLRVISDINAVQEDINLYTSIRRIISNFSSEIADMKTVRVEGKKKLNLSPLVKSLDKKIRKDKLEAPKSNSKLYWFIILILFSFLSIVIFFYIPAKVKIVTDYNVKVEILNHYKFDINENSEKLLELSRGEYILYVTDIQDIVTDTINIEIKYFWSKLFIDIDFEDKIDDYDFLMAQTANRIDVYEEYIIKHPYGRYVEIAKMQIEIIKNQSKNNISNSELQLFEKAKKLNTINAYQNYLNSYPKGIYVEIATKQIEILKNKGTDNKIDSETRAFRLAKNAGTKDAYQRYIDKYPDGKYVQLAQEQIDKLTNKKPRLNEEEAFTIAQENNTIEAYKDYLTKYPNGRYKNKALETIEILKEEKAYLQALNINKVRAYESYLEHYPDGKYAPGAKSMIQGLSAKRIYGMNFIQGGTVKLWNGKSAKVYSFYIDKYEVTVEQYREFCEQTGRSMPKEPQWGWKNDHPIVNVSWKDAIAYAKHKGKRLPTEAEWIIAAGYPVSNLNSIAWFNSNSDRKTRAKALKQANKYGLFDMFGNAAEWCSDWYSNKYPSNSNIINPQGPINGTEKVIRGGSWYSSSNIINISYRQHEKITTKKAYYGFRCVKD